ncbi:ATP-binding protein [Streptomyces sp. NRRL B-3648]|uniref:ATP-binding protein n=1 Tax=Streptomyces sp. NRRL B-3648 TaxID=1519493 RepID=UPI001F3020D8|nr:ATP-binding protein [Streptomyces sp. NRRL B-3648]
MPLTRLDEVPSVAQSLPRREESVPVARHLVRDALGIWELPDLRDTAELVVTELVTNTVRHAGSSTIRVTVRLLAGATVRVAVIDKSHAMPVLLPPTEDALDGRGLAIIDAVSVRWGTDSLPWGKRVWADLETERAPLSVPGYATRRGQAIYILIVVALAALLVASVAHG